jgi:hypothetical protein
MSDAGKVLNLDDLFGLSRPVVVKRLGKRYEMLRPEGLTVKQNNEWQKTAKKMLELYGPMATKTNRKAGELEGLSESMDACLKMLCPSILAEDKPLTLMEKIRKKFHPEDFAERRPFSFAEKLKVLEFYSNEVFGYAPSGKSGRKKHSPTSRKNGSGVSADKAGSLKNRTGA